jgi:ADP-heptose:LPS heptosyltransferase
MDNVTNLCGKTMINDVISIVLNSKFYVGLDSGLTHIAVNTGKKTLCIAQSSNYGFFFPYPDFAHRDNLKVIHASDYETYMNSFMVNPLEPIFLSKLRGSKDVRDIDYGIIVDAIHDWL